MYKLPNVEDPGICEIILKAAAAGVAGQKCKPVVYYKFYIEMYIQNKIPEQIIFEFEKK